MLNGRTDGRTDGRTNDGRKVITIAHPENSSDELKKKTYESTCAQRRKGSLNPRNFINFINQACVPLYVRPDVS